MVTLFPSITVVSVTNLFSLKFIVFLNWLHYVRRSSTKLDINIIRHNRKLLLVLSSPTPQLSVLWTHFKIYLAFEKEVNEFLKYFDPSVCSYLETFSTIFLLLRYNFIHDIFVWLLLYLIWLYFIHLVFSRIIIALH